MWDRDTIFVFKIIWKLFQMYISFWKWLFQTIWNLIIGVVNHHRINSANKTRRGVSTVQQLDLYSVLSQLNLNYITAAAVSGIIKRKVLREYIKISVQDGYTPICFSGNCEELIRSLQSIPGYDFVTPAIDGYDPFFGFTEDEICQLIRQAAASISGMTITNAAIQYLRGAINYLSLRDIVVGFQNIQLCINSPIRIGTQTFDSLIELTENDMQTGRLKPSDGLMIQRLLLSGQSELAKLQEIFSYLYDNLSSYRLNGKVSTLLSALTCKKIILFDTGLFQNNCLFSVIAKSIEICKQRGFRKYAIIVDNTLYENILPVKDMIHRHMVTNPVLFISENLYSLIGGNENEWKSIIGGASTLIIGRQNGSDIAKKLSEHFGQYEKYVITRGKGQGSSHAYYHLFSGIGQQNTFETLSEVDKPKVSVDDLTRLNNNEILVADSLHDSIYHISVDELV